MGWPQSQDYNEAIQNAKTCFKDAELSKGAAVTNPLGMPLPCSGNFADVYQVHCPDTKTRWAVKCFTRGDPKALEERYAKIDQHLQQAKLPFAVGFRYLVEGIRVRKEWHPVLKMQWVEGFTLNHFVRDNLDKPNVLDALLQIWVRMGKRLREADMAHADLQHGNVLLVPGSTSASLAVKLIDYDGMWVPALAGKKSGEVGHPAYQHTKRLYEGTYSKEVDRFPLLVVATALRCLRVGGRPLWERFDNGDNLLFREADLAAPERSPLFAELTKLQDAQAKKLVDTLLKATTEPLEDTPPVDVLLGESAKKQVTATKPVPAAPMAEAAFADLSDPEPTDPSAERRRRRAEPAPAGKKWALIGGGAGAALLATILVLALSGGGKNEPDNGDKRALTQADNRKDDKAISTSQPPPPPQQTPLSIAELPVMRIAPNSHHRFFIKVNGLNSEPGLKVAMQDMPTGVHSRVVSVDPRAGVTEWEIAVAATVPPTDKLLTVVAEVGTRSAQVKLRLIVPEQTVVKPPDPMALPPSPGSAAKGDRVLDASPSHIYSLAISDDGRKVFALTAGTVLVWNTATGKRQVELQDNRIGTGVVNGDGRLITTGPEKNVYAREPGQDQLRQIGTHPAPLHDLALARDGKVAISTGGDVVVDAERKPVLKDGHLVWDKLFFKVWDLEKGKERHSLPLPYGPSQRLAVAGQGKLALGPGRLQTGQRSQILVLWDLEAGRELRTGIAATLPKTAMHFALSADGRFAALSQSDRSLAVWDLSKDRLVVRIDPLPERVAAVAISDDGRSLLTGGGMPKPDRTFTDCFVRLFDVGSGKELLRKEGHTTGVQKLAMTPDARWAVSTANDNTVRFWDLKSNSKPTTPNVTPPPVAEKKPAPTDQQREAALTNLKQVYADEYAKAKPTDRVARRALADTLLARARAINDNPTDRFVLIREAADLYQQLGASGPLLGAIDLLADDFAVDRVALKEQALNDLARATTQPVARKPLAEACLNALEDARSAENFDALTRLAKLAEELAVGSGDAATRAKVTPVVKDARDLVKESEDALKAEATLKMTPDDAAANLVRGKFLCLRIGAWQRGLPLLAKGDDAKLKELAGTDLANPSGADDQAKLADSWFDVSKGLTAGKGEALRRAAHWYNLALDTGLTALNKERVEKQLKAIEPLLPPTRAVQASGELRKLEGHRGAVHRLAFFPDGRLVSHGEGRELRLWNVLSGKQEKTYTVQDPRAGGFLAVGPDGNWIASANTNFIQWTDATGGRNNAYSGVTGTPLSLAYVGKSRRVVVGSEGRLSLGEEASNDMRELDLKNPAGDFLAVAACTGNGGLALAGTSSGTLLLYSVATPTRQTPLRLGAHPKAVHAVALTPDGFRAVSAGEDKTLRVWDVKQRAEVKRLAGHSGTVTALALSPDSRRLATCGEDGTVRVWDMTTYQEVRRFVSHKGKVNAVVFSPDGRRLASAGDDGTIRIWGQ